MKRAHVIVTGEVQGVFFRSGVRSHCKLYNVNGWCRNTKEGDVEAVFEGDKDNIEKVIEYCRKGPDQCKVEKVKVEWEEAVGNFDGFEVR
jgi:acylphosphatase